MFNINSKLYIQNNKKELKSTPIRALKPDRILVYPLNQHKRNDSICNVKAGDYIKMGQIIATANGSNSSNILSSVSGKVIKIENRLTVLNKYCKSIVIENDFKYNKVKNFGVKKDSKDLLYLDLIIVIQNAGIVGDNDY